MDWTIVATQTEEEWFEEYVRLALATPTTPLPPYEQKLGAVDVTWEEINPGEAFIHVQGGSTADRQLVEALVREELKGHGIRQAQFSLDWDLDDPLRKEATWDDIEAKAKRLIQSGQVQILRNGPNNIVGQVQGDHGSYQTEISREDPNSQVITQWQCECWVSDTLVVMADGSRRPIQIVEIGDRVLTASGHVGVVKNTISRQYDGKLYGLRMQGSTETWWATSTHRLFTPEYEPIEAQNITDSTYLYLPKPQIIRSRHGFDAQYLFKDRIEIDGRLYKANKLFGTKQQKIDKRPKNQINRRVHPVLRRWIWTPELMRFLGLYTAEGMVTPRGEIRLFFGPNEQALVDESCEILRALDCEPFVKWSRHAWTVSATNAAVGKVLKVLVGTGSRNKILHGSITQAPEHMLRAFLQGWVDGDGCELKDGRTTLATASDDLSMQLRLILARLGIASVIRTNLLNVSALVPNGKNINMVTWRTDGVDRRRIRYADMTGINQKMTKPEVRDYSGLVYNIEVEADIGGHSYVIGDGIASANCPWDQYAWQRTRQWKKYEGRVCSHCLATYWAARSLPLDEDVHPVNQGGQPGGQMSLFTQPQLPNQFGAPLGGQPGGGAGAPGGQQMMIPGIMPGMATGTPPMPGPGQPQPQDVIPPFPMAPQEGQPVNPASVPGLKQPSPVNPIQYPGGTFSKANDNLEDWESTWYNERDASGREVWERISAAWQDGESSSQVEGRRQAAQPSGFVNGNMVSTKYEDWGEWIGRSSDHGAGSRAVIPAGSVGEVLGVHPSTQMVNVLFMNKATGVNKHVEMEPWGIAGWFWPSDLTQRPDIRPPGPAIKRR